MRRVIAIAILAAGRCLAAESTAPAWSIDQAEYLLVVEKDRVETTVEFTGQTLRDQAGPIPLLENDAVIAGVGKVSGGALVRSDKGQVMLAPDGKRAFRVQFVLLARAQEDSQSAYVTLDIPPALKNSLQVKLPAGLRLIEAPGIPDRNAAFHFSSRDSLSVRFSDRPAPPARPRVELDSFSRVRVQGKRIVLTTFFSPARAMSGAMTLQMPGGATFLESSLKPSWIGPADKDSFEIKLPPDFRDVFSIDLALEQAAETTRLYLPRILDNTGSEGVFAIEEPEDGEVSVESQGRLDRIPASRLSADLAGLARRAEAIMRIQPTEDLRLTFRRFERVSTPAVVLKEQRFYSAFEENGNVLSILAMDIPARMGTRVRLKAVPGAEIWSLTVNNQPARVYSDADAWVIPLSGEATSHVELAYLRRGEKLGLQGRLETWVPETGLPAEVLRVGLALPHRVELLSIEGAVSPDPDGAWSVPDQSTGRPHFFSRSFHKGGEMPLALSYKEPVKRK